jgi:acetolactate synthase-1/2/3 large subunit
VVALIGDGSFNYNPVLAAFGFAQEYEMPILVILFNNQGYLTMKEDLRRYYPKGWAVKTDTFVGTSIRPDPDYPALARAYGGYGEKVEQPDQVRSALARGLEAIDSGQLALLDFRLQPVN